MSIFKDLSILIASAGLIGACAAGPSTGNKDGIPNAAPAPGGKSDDVSGLVEHGDFEFGTPSTGSFDNTQLSHAWNFNIAETGTVNFFTSPSGTEVDTRLYLYKFNDGDFDLVVENDDAEGRDLYSEINAELGAGEYRVMVGSYSSPTTGDFGLDGTCTGCEQEVVGTDIYADARNVDLEMIILDEQADPGSYQRPSSFNGFGLGGTEFWQKWPGGENPTYSYGDGSDAGKKCMNASAIRFNAIMEFAPAELSQLLADSKWGGRFFNWNDDYSMGSSDARGARLWWWRTGLGKWISQTGKDGKCFLPTLEMVQRAADNCLADSSSREGEIQGCTD